MKMTLENLEKQKFVIKRVSTRNVKSKRRYAELGNVFYVECSKCDMFKTSDHYHFNKTGFRTCGSYCKECTNMRRDEYNKPSRYQQESYMKSEKMVAFRIDPVGDYFMINYVVGNSFDWKPADNIEYSRVYEARSAINSELTNKIEMMN